MAVLIVSGFWVSSAYGAGQHSGEVDKIRAVVNFLTPSGQTTTDASGITYRAPAYNFQSFEPKVYPPAYWGTYPLYFVGQTMNFTVTLTNTAASGNKKFKVRVQALNNVLEISGSVGRPLGSPQEWTVEDLRPGESRTLNGSVYIAPDPTLPSGLDLTKIRISHLNEGNNQDAGLILEDFAVWCPPKTAP